MNMKQQIQNHRNSDKTNGNPKSIFQFFRFHLACNLIDHNSTNQQKNRINKGVVFHSERKNHQYRKQQTVNQTQYCGRNSQPIEDF